MTFDPTSIALSAIAKTYEAVKEVPQEQETSVISSYEYKPNYTGYFSYNRLDLPPDGWGTTEYKKYISKLWFEKTRKINNNSNKYDLSQIKSKIIDIARYNYNLPNVAIVDLVTEFFRQESREQDNIPYWAFKKWITHYYNANEGTYRRWAILDEELAIVPRMHLVLESGEKLRISMARYFNCRIENDKIFVDNFDPRLLMQLGIPAVYKWLHKQTAHTEAECVELVLSGINLLIQSDNQSTHTQDGYSKRMETCVRNTINFEPYPWTSIPKAIDIRHGLMNIVESHGFTSADWWKSIELRGDKDVPSCLEKIKSKSRDLPKLIKNKDFVI